MDINISVFTARSASGCVTGWLKLLHVHSTTIVCVCVCLRVSRRRRKLSPVSLNAAAALIYVEQYKLTLLLQSLIVCSAP